MRQIPFSVERAMLSGHVDAAYLDDDEPLARAVMEQIWQNMATDVLVTIGGVTMFAAAWEDPEHWAEDWAEKLGIDYDKVPGVVEAIIEGAVREGR